MEDFLAIGKDVNESDEERRTPLHYAVAYNHAGIVEELITNGANLEAQVQLLCNAMIADSYLFSNMQHPALVQRQL